jgi:hypothetical protein
MRQQPTREQSKQPPETSSCPIPIAAEQCKLFHAVLTLFEEGRISYAIAGAFALWAHTGIGRDTKDLDVFLTAKDAQIALRYLADRGFVCEVCDPVWLFKVHRGPFFVDLITGMSNAALVVQDSWIEHAHPSVVAGVQSRVLAPEELLVSKLFITRRERFDGSDIAHIIYGTKGRLDWQRVLSLIGEHWEMLLWALILFRYAYPAQTHYVPRSIWDELTRRFQDALSHPDPNASFRGSLIDDKMFAIDVNEWGMADLLTEFRKRRLQSLSPSPRAA